MELSFKERFLMAEFKASAIYDTPGDICTVNLLTDLPSRLCDDDRTRLGVFTGNCLVVEMLIPRTGESRYLTYVFDPLGYPTLIPESSKHSQTKEKALAWVESDDFRANKSLYISQAALEPHEHAEDTVFVLCCGFVANPLFRRHRRFRMAFDAWLAEQVDDDGDSIF